MNDAINTREDKRRELTATVHAAATDSAATVHHVEVRCWEGASRAEVRSIADAALRAALNAANPRPAGERVSLTLTRTLPARKS